MEDQEHLKCRCYPAEYTLDVQYMCMSLFPVSHAMAAQCACMHQPTSDPKGALQQVQKHDG